MLFRSALVEASQKAGMTVGDWESGKVAYAPAGLGALGTLQTTAIYGISGQWPNMIRLASNPETRQFELAEVIGLQSLRQEGKNLEESGMIKMDKEMIKNLLEKIRSEFGNTPEFKMIEEKLN